MPFLYPKNFIDVRADMSTFCQEIRGCCRVPDLFEDHVTGDTVCRTCGLCVHDILLDSFGQQPANESHKLLASCGGSIEKGGNLRRALGSLLSMNGRILVVGWVSNGRGDIQLGKVCSPISYTLHRDNSGARISVYRRTRWRTPIMKRITKSWILPCGCSIWTIARWFQDEGVGKSGTKFANTASNAPFHRRLSSDVSRLSKNGKVKTSICLFHVSDRLREISQHLNRYDGNEFGQRDERFGSGKGWGEKRLRSWPPATENWYRTKSTLMLRDDKSPSQ